MHRNSARKTSNKLIPVFLSIITILASWLLPIRVVAQNLGNNVFSLSPIDYTNNQVPGDSFSVSFTVSNQGSQDAEVNLYKAEMEFTDNQPRLSLNNLATADWLALSQTFYIIPANSSATITANVQIPGNATPGAYYPTILISEISDTADITDSPTEAIVNSALAFRINLNVIPSSETVIKSAKASGLVVTNPVVINSVDISYGITNVSDYYVKPIAYLQIVNPSGEVVWRSTVNDNNSLIYPGQVLAASTNLQLPAFKPTDVGQYTAEFLVVDNQFGTTDIIKTNFTVIPLSLLLVLGGVIVLLSFLLIWRSRKQRRY